MQEEMNLSDKTYGGRYWPGNYIVFELMYVVTG